MPASNRVAEHPIHEQFTQRWSPRAFTDASIDKSTLLSFFEAAAGRHRRVVAGSDQGRIVLYRLLYHFLPAYRGR